MATDNISKLYKNLTEDGYKLGSEAEFRNALKDEAKARRFHKNLTEDGYKLGTYDEFSQKVGTSRTAQPVRTVQQQPQQAATQPQVQQPTGQVNPTVNTSTQPKQEEQPQQGWKPSAAQMWAVHQGISDFNAGMQRQKEDVHRMTGSMTREGRQREKSGEMQARMAGTPTRLAGVMPGAKSGEVQTEGEENRGAGTLRGPVPYGVVVENGEKKTQWLMPDGSVTTDLAKADAAEKVARETRAAHEWERRKNDPQKQLEDADKLMEEIDEMLAEEREKLNSMAVSDAKENPFLAAIVTSQGGDITDMKRYNKAEIGNLEVAKRTLEDTKRMVNEAAHNEEGRGWLERSFGAGLLRGLYNGAVDVSTWDLGITDLKDSILTLSALDDFDKGKQLTPSQQKLLDAKATQVAIEMWASKNVGWGYEAGQVTAQAIPFMLEMMMNPAASTGNLAVNKLARYTLRRWGKKYVAGKVIARVAGDVAGAAMMSATTGLGRVAAEANRLQQGDIDYDLSSSGRIAFGGHEKGKSVGEAWGQAFITRTIENQTEMAGEYFGVVGGVITRALSKTPVSKLMGYVAKWGRKVTPESVIDFVKAVPKTEWAKGVARIQKRGKYDGLFGEYGEEVLGNVENAIIFNDDEHNFGTGKGGVFNLEDNLKTFVTLIPMQVAFGVIRSAGYWTRKRDARKRMEKLGNDLRATMSADDLPMWETLQANILGQDNGVMVDALHEALTRSNLSLDQRRKLLDYAKAAMVYKTMDAMEDEELTDASEGERKARLSYDAAYTRDMDASLRMADAAVEKYREHLNRFMTMAEIAKIDEDPIAWLRSEEYETMPRWQRRLVEKYINARASHDGASDRVRDEIEGRIDEISRLIDGRTNKQTGTVQRAKMKNEKNDEREVWVIDGTVVMDEEGVDKGASSSTLVVKDSETGRVEMVDIDVIGSADNPKAAEQAKEEARAATEQEASNDAAREQGGELQPGQRMKLVDGGRTRAIEVLLNNGDTYLVRDMVVGENGQVEYGSPREMYRDEFWSMREDYLLQRVMEGCRRDVGEMLKFEAGEKFEAITDNPDEVAEFEIVKDNGDGTVTYKNAGGGEFVAPKSVLQWAANDAYEHGINEAADNQAADDGASDDGEVEEARNDIVNVMSKQASDRIDGTLPFMPGDNYMMMYPDDGSIHNVQIAEDLGDGTVSVLLDDAQEPTVMSKEDIQGFADKYRIDTLQAEDSVMLGAEDEEQNEDNEPDYALNDVVSLQTEDGTVRGQISNEANEDGLIEVYTEKPIGGKKINLFTREQLNNMLVDRQPAAQPVTQPAPQAPAADGVQPLPRPVIPDVKPEDMTDEAIAAEIQALRDYDHHPATLNFDNELIARRDALLAEQERRRANAPVAENEMQPADTNAGAAEPQPAAPIAETVPPQPTAPLEQQINEPMPMRDDGKKDYVGAGVERSERYIYDELGLDGKNADKVVANNIKKAEENLKKARKKADSITDPEEMQAADAAIKAAEQAKAFWEGVRSRHAERVRAAQEERDRVAHEAAVERDKAEYEARKQAEAERKAVGNENPMPAITEKWNNARKIYGRRETVVLPNGERVTGRWVLHESGATTPSHSPVTWEPTEGFPMDDNDNTVNDRDYKGDKDAQRHVESLSRTLDRRAWQTPVMVSRKHGITLSGNGRTMARELAVLYGTDGQYVSDLKEDAEKFSFTPEQVESFEHPTLSFEVDEPMPYTAETFAKFNQQEMKSQNKTEQAVKLGKTVSDDIFKRIVRAINSHDTIGDFYNDAEASLGAVYALHNAGVIPQAQLAEMVDGSRGNEKLSAVGREFLENLLIGKAFEGEPDVVRMLTDVPAMRQTVVTALGELADNIALGDGWSLRKQLADAVKLCHDALNSGAKHGDIVSLDARRGVMFADPDELQTAADYNDATMLMLADTLNDTRVTMLRTVIALYNGDARSSAAGEMDVFGGGVRSREEILRNVIKYFNDNYGRKKELDAARSRAAELRKADSGGPGGEDAGAEQAGAASPVNDEGEAGEQRLADSGRDTEQEAGLSEDEADDLILASAERAIPMPEFELTPENWKREFGNGTLETPIEQIKIGENQFSKMIDKGREKEAGLIKPTFTDPDFVIEEASEAADGTTERATSHLYVKSFIGNDGKKHYFFKSVTVKRDGLEVNVSSHFDRPKRLREALKKGKLLYRFDGGAQTEQSPATASVTTSRVEPGTSEGKGSENSETGKEKTEKVAESKASTAIAEAEQEVNTEPTDAQKEAGNYKKGHIKLDGFDISIEQPKGSTRSGRDASGKEWSVTMQNTYGYIRGTEGVDGDHIDVFLSDNMDEWNGTVYVIDQVKADGSFDEHKVMYGFNSAEEAAAAYNSNYSEGWQGLGTITGVSKEEFKKWIGSSHRKTKPFAEYRSVKPLGDTQLGEQSTAGYSIEPTTYTNKKGKTTPMHLVTFGRELSKDEIRAGKELAKESRGWWDSKQGGFMMRDEDSAKALAEALSNEEAVQDAQPLSLGDVQAVTDQADMKAVDETIKVEQEPQTTPQYDYDREDDVYDKTLTGLRNVLNDRKRGAIPNIKSIENVIRDLRKRAKTIEDGMATAAGETIPQAFDALANLNGRRKAYEQFLVDIRRKMAETERDDALAAHGVKLGDKIMYKGKEATIHDADARQVTLDVGLAPVMYEVTDWKNVEVPKREPATPQPKKVNVESLMGELNEKGEAKLSDHTEEQQQEESTEQPKQEEKKAKSKWVDDEDAEEFERLSQRFRKKLGGQFNMGLDPEAFAIGVKMSYLVLKHGARKFADFARQMIDALGNEVRPYIKSLYNGARDLPEMSDIEKEMTPYDEVRAFDVMNFDKEGAKDIVATAEHIVREQAAEREAKEATDKLKQERNEQRKETEQEVAANTEALASEAATVASEVESKLPSARSEREVNDLAKNIDDAIDKVNDQLALLGYYEAEPVESDFNEAYGYMRNAEKKAVKNVTELFKTLTKELGISDPVVYDAKGKKQKSVTANIAPAGGDVTMRFMLNRDKGVELYIDFMLEPDYENNRDNLVLKGIMFRPEKNLPNGGRDYLRANNFFPVDVTVPQMLHGIRSVCQEWLPAEDYVAMAQRIAAENAGNQKENTSKGGKSKKKSVSLQQQTIPDLFSGLFGEEDSNLKPTSNEQEVHVQPRTSTTERERGHQRGQNEPLGESKQHEDERPDAGGVVRRSGNDTLSNTERSTPVSEPSDGKRNLKPAKKEFAPISESERKNTHNNHAERGTDYAPKGTSARIEANIKAIETMQRLIESGKPATPEDMSVLRKFSGWGGLGAAFKEKVSSGDSGYNPRLRDDYQPANPINARLRELLSPEAYEAANMSRNSAYYTPAPVIDAMWDVARAMGFRGGNVLEGSAGIGNIIGLMPTDMSDRSNIHAVEIDETTGNILSLLYPDANVEVKGFEKTYVPNGSVDLAVTNVPFVTGLRVMDETGDKDLSRKFHDIHDFCIAKNVRKLKEGGIGIFITSSGTLDSPNSAKLRTWLVNDGGADVVGAFRMHNQTFGGTGATSDIIVIRKRVNGRKSANAIDVSGTLPIRTVKYNTGETKRGSSEVVIKDLALDVNKHFVEHPEDMAGEMAFAFEKGDTYRATSKALYPSPSINQEQRLSEWAQQFKDMDWDKAEERESQQIVYEDLGEDVKEGSMLLDSDGNLCLAQRGKAVPINVNANKVKGHSKAECFNAYKAIKDALADVLEYQTTHSDDKGLQQRLAKLNKSYDDFVKTYGHLNKNTSISFLRSDMDYPSIAALESVSETGDKSGKRIVTYGKTDIFSRRVVETESEPKPTTIKDGIIASIYLNGRVDVPYIAEQLNMSDSDVRQQIIESGLGFENPTTTEMEVSYEYLSGNVREKLRQAQENNTDGRYDANIKALERVIPMNIPAHLIEFTLGSSWVEPKLYEDFVKERTGLDVKLTNAGGTWLMNEPWYTSTEQNKAMGVISEMCDKTILGHELIKAAITCKSISVTKTVSTGYGSSKTTETIVDKEATMACANKIDEIRQDFKDWARGKMQSDPEMSERMERVYNELFNNSVPKEIPDDFVPEHFGGAATVVNGKPFKLRPHQAKAVIRGTTQPLMLAHEVGTGKTYTLISTAMEMRRLGTARKPMIVVQNATVGQFVASAKALYPNAKILTLEDADRNAEGRRNFYAKIRYNDWDMIVVPQSVFERIPDSEERQIRFVEDKVEEKMMVLEKMREAAADDRDPVLRQAQRELDQLNDELNNLKLALNERKEGKTERDEKREAKTKQNAMVKAQEMLDRETDDVANFDDMGIDALLIDEAHEYKHLGFATAMQRGVKGVDPSYSKKSQGVYLKTQAVLESKNGKNVVFATGTPISNTAAEIWTFMRYLMPADTMREYGIYYFDDFVRNFGNIQQMLEFATNGKYKENNRFAGYVNLPELVRIWAGVADTVLTREAGGVSDKIPKMEGGKAQDIYLPQTKALRGVMKFVNDQLDDYDKMSGKEKKENSHIPLVMYGIAKAAAVDARLVLEDAADEPNSKTNEAVRQTLRSLEDTKDYNGTVAIFADNYQNKATGFNLYEDIRKKLIDAGVPEAQVVVMKSGMSIKKKLELFDKVNRGEVRVIMGSTATLGTGVNIQERLHTLIHVDAPNRPMDYTQRNGRILRQGNLHKEWGIPVRVLRFGVEDSLDVTAYQRLKTKGAIADSIMEGKKMMSNSMENRVLEEEQDLFGDITAQLSGSQYALLKNQVEKEVKKLEARKKQWEADQTYVHNQKPRLKALIKDSEERAKRNKEALAKVEAAKNDGITIGKMKFPTLDAMADYIKDYNSKQREQQEQVRAASGYQAEAKSDLTINVGGFDFHIHRVISKEQKQEKGQLSLSFFSKTQMTYSCPELELEDVPVDGQRLKSALEDILENVLSGDDFREKAEYADRAAERYKGELQQVEARDGKPFEYADELKQAKEKLAEYEELMKAEMAEKEAKYAEMDASVEAAKGVQLSDEDSDDVTEDTAKYRIREDEPPTKTGIGYKVFVLKDGKLYPPMVANPNGEATPVGVWLDADAAPVAGVTKTGRQQVKAGGKGTQGGSGKLAYRPGWHLGEIPYALQFNRMNPETGQRELFPANFVWAEVEYANDVDYQEEAMSYGMNASGKFQHSLAGLPRLPENGSYRYRTNPDPNTDPWVITGAMKVNRILKPSEVDAMVEAAGREPQQRQAGAITDEQVEALNAKVKRTMQEDRDMMRSAVEQMGKRLNTPIKIYNTPDEVTHSDPEEQARRRKSKGWYDPNSREIGIVLSNNADVDDVKASVGHETIAHKGLRELVGEERWGEFLDETYQHLRDDLKKGVDAAAGRAFIDDTTKNGKRAKSYEQHRRTAVDELFGRLAEKPFEDFNGKERNLWQWLKAKVRHLLDKFLGSLKLPKWFELGDNELRYMLWRSKERLEHGKEHPIDLAHDIVKREELGLDETIYSRGKKTTPSERDGAVSGNPSAEGLPQGGSAHQSRNRHAQPLDGAKVRQNTEVTMRSIKKILNKGEILDGKRPIKTESQAVRALGNALHLDRADTSQSYYGDFYEGDLIAGDQTVRVRISTHPANGARIGNAPTNDKVSIVIRKNGEHFSSGEHKGYTEYVYEPGEISPADAANAIVKGIEQLIVTGEFVDETGKAHREDYPRVENGVTLYRPMDDTSDVWSDMSMGFDERITAAATRLANNHRANRTMRDNAMRAIGGNLTNLRRAMSLQRHFDITTVKRVADLARVLISSGYFNDMTANEVNRLLSAVKNSVGHEDVEASVQKVMDIMVDNQLKNVEASLHEIESVKATKVDVRGVEVQGELDPDGAHIIKVFKRTRGWDKTDIEAALNEAMDRMGSNSNAVADEAALDYAALQIALQYSETVKGSKVEEQQLRDELRQRKAEASIEERRSEAFKEYVAETEDAIRQNKIERVQAYYDVVQRLAENLGESVARAKAFREAEKARVNEIHHNANSDMEGRPSNEHYHPKFMDKFVNNSIVQGLFAPLATFDQMLRLFGDKSANGEGYLYNRFMRGWVDARQKEIKGVRDKFAALDAKAAEVFDGKVKTWGDLIRRVGKMPTLDVEFWDGGEMRAHQLTQGNLMYIYMVNKMLDGRMKLRRMGITEEDVEAIRRALDPRFIELGDWLQEEFLVNTRNEYNETHKRMFGASMAAIEDYFPLRILENALTDKAEDLDNPNRGNGISTATGSIIKRRRNNKPLDITNADALSVILDHIAEMEHWNAFAEFNRDLNTLRTYKRFRNQVQNMTTIYGSGSRLWKKFNDVCQMAAGTYRPPRAMLDEAAVNFAKGVTAAKVTYRTFTALKQFLSLPAYLPEARPDHLVSCLAAPWKSWNWCMENLPIFNERWHSRMAGDPRLLKSDMDWKMWRSRIMQLASRAGMSPNAFVDALTVSIGAYAIYKTRLSQYKSEGYSQADAEHRAKQDAEVLYNQTQQSSEGAFTSTMQVDRSWLAVLFTVFRNSPMSYQRQLHDAIRNFGSNLGSVGRARTIEFMKKQYVRDGIDEAQAEKNAKRKFRRQLLKDTIRVATFGYILQLAWNLGAYLPYMLVGDDDDEKQKLWDDVWAHTAFGSVEGLTGGDVLSQALTMAVTGDGNPSYLRKDMPLTSDLFHIARKAFGDKKEEALTDIINLVVQSGIGVNPQSITDGVLAIVDACEGDPRLSKEAALCVMRVMQVPQSQLDKIYFDELGMSARDAQGLDAGELARRYARYRIRRGYLLTPWVWEDEALDKKYEDKFTDMIVDKFNGMDDETLFGYSTNDPVLGDKRKNAVKKRMDGVDDSALQSLFDNGDEVVRKIVANEAAKRAGGKDTYVSPDTEYGEIYLQKRDYFDLVEDVLLSVAQGEAETRNDAEREYAIGYIRQYILTNTLSGKPTKKIELKDETREKLGAYAGLVLELKRAKHDGESGLGSLGGGKNDEKIMELHRTLRREILKEFGITPQQTNR